MLYSTAKKRRRRQDWGSCQTISPPSVNLHLLQSERQLFLWGEAAGRQSPSALPPCLSTHSLHLSINHHTRPHPSSNIRPFLGADTHPWHSTRPCTAFVSHLITSHLQCEHIPTRMSFLILDSRDDGNVCKCEMCSGSPLNGTREKGAGDVHVLETTAKTFKSGESDAEY